MEYTKAEEEIRFGLGGRAKTGDPVLLKPEEKYNLNKRETEIWEEFAEVLFHVGITSEVDGYVMRDLVTTYHQFELIEEDIRAFGHCNADGKRYGWSNVYFDLSKKLMALYAEVGFTPKSRGLVKIPAAEEQRRKRNRDIAGKLAPHPDQGNQDSAWGKFNLVVGGKK